jgi:enoyl-CoA hydratase
VSVHVEINPPLLTITINRPTTLNAIDFGVMESLEDAISMAEKDAKFRVVVLTGAGTRSFISGGDLRRFAKLTRREQVGMMALRMRVILERLEKLDAWVIAAVNGPAYGGGCETSLACDFRIAAAHATFGFTQANFSVPPGWGGLTRLVEVVGKPTALRWLAESAIVSADEALRAGLVHEVVAADRLEEAVRAWATRLSQHERPLIGAIKQGMVNAHSLPRRDAIEAELGPFVDCWLSDEHRLRIEAFLERTLSD